MNDVHLGVDALAATSDKPEPPVLVFPVRPQVAWWPSLLVGIASTTMGGLLVYFLTRRAR